jgi:hypothetical protein
MLTLKISTNAIKDWCPHCKKGTKADVLSSNNDYWEYYRLPSMAFVISINRVLRYQGCTVIYSQRETIENNDEATTVLDFHDLDADGLPYSESSFEYWRRDPVLPEKGAPQAREPPHWLVELPNDTLKTLLDETYSALKSGLLALSAMGARAVLDSTMQLLGATPTDGFARKLSHLESQGKISPQQKADLVVLTDAGSAASHRGWRPEPEDMNTILDVIEDLLKREFTRPKAIVRLKGRIPPKPTPVVRLDSRRPGRSPGD